MGQNRGRTAKMMGISDKIESKLENITKELGDLKEKEGKESFEDKNILVFEKTNRNKIINNFNMYGNYTNKSI